VGSRGGTRATTPCGGPATSATAFGRPRDGAGLATWALGRILDQARVLGMDRLLIVCEADNVASSKTTERLGGVLEDLRDTADGAARRYWIAPST